MNLHHMPANCGLFTGATNRATLACLLVFCLFAVDVPCGCMCRERKWRSHGIVSWQAAAAALQAERRAARACRYMSEDFGGSALHPIDVLDAGSGRQLAQLVDANLVRGPTAAKSPGASVWQRMPLAAVEMLMVCCALFEWHLG